MPARTILDDCVFNSWSTFRNHYHSSTPADRTLASLLLAKNLHCTHWLSVLSKTNDPRPKNKKRLKLFRVTDA
jgi:hypothetical protein